MGCYRCSVIKTEEVANSSKVEEDILTYIDGYSNDNGYFYWESEEDFRDNLEDDDEVGHRVADFLTTYNLWDKDLKIDYW